MPLLDKARARHMLRPMAVSQSGSAFEGRKVSLFRNGVNQAVRIPKEFELPTSQALLFREGNRLIIEAYPRPPTLLATLESLEPIDESFPDVDVTLLPVDPVDFP